MIEFLNMGGYALYVWTSYALALIILGGVVLWSARRYRSVRLSAIRRAQQHRRKKIMTPKRKQRLMLVGVMLGGVAIAVAFGVNAFKENIMLFHSPSDVTAGDIEPGKPFRIGGMVVEGSVKRSSEDLAVRFELTDHAQTVPVAFTGILPDLFREGQGIVALGALDAVGTFSATEVLAKHDENYMPPEVADALERAGNMPGTAAKYGTKAMVEP